MCHPTHWMYFAVFGHPFTCEPLFFHTYFPLEKLVPAARLNTSTDWLWYSWLVQMLPCHRFVYVFHNSLCAALLVLMQTLPKHLFCEHAVHHVCEFILIMVKMSIFLPSTASQFHSRLIPCLLFWRLHPCHYGCFLWGRYLYCHRNLRCLQRQLTLYQCVMLFPVQVLVGWLRPLRVEDLVEVV